MSTRPRIWLIAAGLSMIEAIGGYTTGALAEQPIPVRREILALYDGAQEGDAGLSRIHRFAEMPLNHLGFILRFHDVRTRLPEPAEMERYRGVLTWFAGSVANSNAYLAWASQISRINVRYVILGDIGVATNSTNILTVNRWLESAGISAT